MKIFNLRFNFVFCLILFVCSAFPMFAQEETAQTEKNARNEDLSSYTLEIADKISTFSLKGKIFFMFTDSESDVIEVSPVRSDICRVVISVPQVKGVSSENYTVYLRKNDLVLFQRGNKTYGGYVKDFDYNLIRFTGKITE